MVPSVPEMVEETSQGEELGEDEEVGLRAELLLRPLPEAPALPVLKAHLVVVKNIKTQQPQVLQGKKHPPRPRLWSPPGSAPLPKPS